MAQINNNTTSLEEILNTVNSLPEAGSGSCGGVQTANVTIRYAMGMPIYYIDSNGTVVLTGLEEIECLIPSFIVGFNQATKFRVYSGSAVLYGNSYAVFVTGDCEIEVTEPSVG